MKQVFLITLLSVSASLSAQELSCGDYLDVIDQQQLELDRFQQSQIEPREARMQEINNEIYRRGSQIRGLEKNNSKLQSEIAFLQKRKQEIPGEVRNLQKRKDVVLPQEVAELQKEQRQLENEIANAGWVRRQFLKPKLNKVKRKIQERQSEIRSIPGQIKNLQNFAASVDSKVSLKQQEIQQNNNRIVQIRAKVPTIAQLQSELQVIQDELTNQDLVKRKLQKSLALSRFSLRNCRELRMNKEAYRQALRTVGRISLLGCAGYAADRPVFQNPGRMRGEEDAFNAYCNDADGGNTVNGVPSLDHKLK